MTEISNHIGRKISRIRELRGLKQEYVAAELGVSQQAVSKMEQREYIGEEALKKIAEILGVSAEAVKAFSDEGVINYFNTFNDNSFSNSQGTFSPNHCTFNPIDKLVEAYEENKRLYERLLQSEREKVELLKNQGK